MKLMKKPDRETFLALAHAETDAIRQRYAHRRAVKLRRDAVKAARERVS